MSRMRCIQCSHATHPHVPYVKQHASHMRRMLYRMRYQTWLVSHTLHMCRMRNNRHVVYAKHSTLHMRYMACVACGAFNVRMRHIHMYRMRNSIRLACDALCTACDTKLCVGENKKWYIKNIFLKKSYIYIWLTFYAVTHTDTNVAYTAPHMTHYCPVYDHKHVAHALHLTVTSMFISALMCKALHRVHIVSGVHNTMVISFAKHVFCTVVYCTPQCAHHMECTAPQEARCSSCAQHNSA